MDEVALAVQHDVSIVSVFNLQQEEHQAVSCHAADEVVACLEVRETDEICAATNASKNPCVAGVNDQQLFGDTSM